MKIKDIRALSEKDLEKKKDELDKELIKLYAQSSTGSQVKSPGQIRQMKRTKAQILTVLKEKGNKKA